MRNRFSLLFIVVLSALGVTTTAYSAVPNQGVSVGLPGVRSVHALEICTEAAGKTTCRKVATPEITRGRVSARWNRGLGANVLATPVTPFPAQCNGRPGALINAKVGNIATDITFSVEASYAGVTTPRTLVSVKRTVRADKGAAVWACLL